jgi:hypothetical protein
MIPACQAAINTDFREIPISLCGLSLRRRVEAPLSAKDPRLICRHAAVGADLKYLSAVQAEK